MNKISNIILIFFIFLTPSLRAADVNEADSAYKAGNYEKAEALYSSAIEKDGISAGLLYNLGNTYYKLGKDGEAMVCYERAKRIEPGNKIINQNLNFLRNKVQDANKGSLNGKSVNVEPEQESFLDGIYKLIAIDQQSNSWAVLAVMAFIIFLGSLSLYIFTPNVLARKTGFFSGLVFLGFTVVFLIFAFMGANQYDREDEAVLISYTTELLDQPASNSKTVSTPLHKGTKLKVLETQTGADGKEWLKVRLNGDNVGWVKKEGLEII